MQPAHSMAEESSTTWNLSVAMTTMNAEKMSTTDANSKTSLSSNFEFYSTIAVVVVGFVGMVGNALVLYALFASKQHKKLILIVNQNALDLVSSFSLLLIYILKLYNIYLSGTLGYWLCMLIFSENFMWSGTNGATINLAAITIDRYLKVVHPVWSRKWLRPWVIYLGVAFSWLAGIGYNTVVVFVTSIVIDGICYGYYNFVSDVQYRAYLGWYIASFYFVILVIFTFCYGRILVAVRRQARVMAAHSATGTSTAQTQAQAQAHHIQSNVIKTMVLVSAFYAITWGPANVYYVLALLNYPQELTANDSRYYATLFVGFLYTSANPFIYATKFNPVRKVLKNLIFCRNQWVNKTFVKTKTDTF